MNVQTNFKALFLKITVRFHSCNQMFTLESPTDTVSLYIFKPHFEQDFEGLPSRVYQNLFFSIIYQVLNPKNMVTIVFLHMISEQILAGSTHIR